MGLRQWTLKVRRNAGLYNFSRICNPVYGIFTGGKKRPAFYDIDSTIPTLRQVDAAYPVIRAELDRILLQQDAMPRYHELDTDLIYSSGRYHRSSRWNVFMLYCYDSLPEANRELCPRTCEAIAKIPHLNQAFFSILDPGKSIPAHTGPTQAYLRYHLGLVVPENNAPSIRIRDEFYTWKEGESVLFDDSLDHEVINKSDGIRAVLILDVMRPFPEPIFTANRIFRHLGVWFYGPRLVRKANAFRLQNSPAQQSEKLP
ncbi:aspartyl/asparaginyl beta-hydroxylase domain-containing protein [Silvibacterium acidisoli]|uniref:aspartyl/asparaginyl beta-hydroxylase domain-containing protein n=1 Tax=Acidobacteriaceae bacterium ZG23-2 TaxID=2883246 RepID=UPI00406C11E7